MAAKAGLALDDIGFAFYSHMHMDHVADLLPLLFASVNPLHPRSQALTLGGSKEFLDYVKGQKLLHPRLFAPSTYEIELTDILKKGFSGDGWKLRAVRAAHHPSSIAMRIDAGGKSLVYSGDTDYSEELVSLADGCDAFLVECSFPGRLKAEGHLTPALAGRMAAEAGAGRVILTHFYPECDTADLAAECRSTFPGEIILAEDLMEIEIA
jgi:ribonuclease BN (tRNA processing enzyme)